MPERSPILEIACFNTESALNAEGFGAHRIELCQNRDLGGTTPDYGVLATLIDGKLSRTPFVNLTIYVMIRPHGEHFEYSPEDFDQMCDNIQVFQKGGASGFVFGILKKDAGTGLLSVDEERCRILVHKARGFPCTFHRAFDEIPEGEMLEQLEVLIRCGFKAVLTSGGKPSAVEGKGMLKKLVDKANVSGRRIDVVVGGGVRSSNIKMLREETGATCFHSSAIVAENCNVADRAEIGLLKEALCCPSAQTSSNKRLSLEMGSRSAI